MTAPAGRQAERPAPAVPAGGTAPGLADLPPPPAGRAGWPWTAAPPPLPARRADGSPWPRISVVTCSHNQAAFLEETLRSVLLQGYPNLEYIVIDGGSSDASLSIIERYAPWLAHWEAQPDRGQAAALDSGFAHAGGEILAWLNSDDTYLPGALERAAREVDPRRNRHLVTARCLFVDSAGRPTGSEHPSRAVGHLRVLAVWKGHTVPQPATFWSRAAWRAGGPLATGAGMRWIDYGLFCRMTRRYRLHAIDALLATYRLHADSITVSTGREAARQQVLDISRRYWGPRWAPRHLWLAASLALHRRDRRGRGRAVLSRALAARALGEGGRFRRLLARAALTAPGVVCRWAAERLRARGGPALPAACLERLGERAARAAGETADPWPDGWIGPLLALELTAAGGERRVRIQGTAARGYVGAPLALAVRADGRRAGGEVVQVDGAFGVELPLPAAAAPGRCRIEVAASPYFVPDTLLGNGDQRRLCWKLQDVRLLA